MESDPPTPSVVGWMEPDPGACSFYRMSQPFKALRDAGWDAQDTRSIIGQDVIDAGADMVVAQRVTDVGAAYLLHLMSERGVPYLYEVDDLLNGVDPENPVSAYYAKEEVQNAIWLALRGSIGATVSTPELAERIGGDFGVEARVLPNCLPDYFSRIPGKSGVENREDGRVRVVWAGSLTHHGDFHKEVVRGVMSLRGRTDAEFYSVGADYRGKLRGIGQHVPWSESIPEFHLSLPQYDIGLAPLSLTPFNRCKSELKVMEYQAAGVVPVAQDCPAYRRVIEHGVDGFLCRTEWDWRDAITSLVEDHDLRARMRAAGMAHTDGRLMRSNVHRWEAVYREAVRLS